MPDQAVLVQFPHSGVEHHRPKSDVMPWNRRPHARKFLRARLLPRRRLKTERPVSRGVAQKMWRFVRRQVLQQDFPSRFGSKPDRTSAQLHCKERPCT